MVQGMVTVVQVVRSGIFGKYDGNSDGVILSIKKFNIEPYDLENIVH